MLDQPSSRRRGARARASVSAPRVTAIVVTYESGPFIDACLTSLRAHAKVPLETIVVDNASRDDTLDRVRSHSPESTLLALPRNRGFAAAANLGAAQARAPYLLFLNPDAQLEPGALPALLAHLESDLTVAAAGPQLIHPDGSAQDAAFTYPTLLMTWLEFFPHPGRVLSTRLNGRLASTNGQPIAVDHPLGACILVRRTAWMDVGPFDEGYFLYCEEVDWCMRARRHGWAIAHVPAAVVTHHGGASAATNRAASLVHLYSSRLRLHRKHRGVLFRVIAASIMRIGLTQERHRLAQQAATVDPAARAAARLSGIERALRLFK